MLIPRLSRHLRVRGPTRSNSVFTSDSYPRTIRVTKSVLFPSYWPPVGADPKDPAQRLPLPKPYIMTELDPSQGARFEASRPLSVGGYRWSQVYLGSLASAHGKEENVVLKIFVPTLFPKYDTEAGRGNVSRLFRWSENSYRYTDEVMAWTEASMYNKLARMQGDGIPRFLGTFMVRLPDSEKEYFAVAKSYVDGTPSIIERAIELGGEINGDRRWYPLARELHKKVDEFHKVGVANLDVHGCNILVVRNPGSENVETSSSESLVFFDFAFARPNSFRTKKENKRHGAADTMFHDECGLVRVMDSMMGGDFGKYSDGLEERRRAFFRWARREYAGDTWLKRWENYCV